MFAAGSHGSGFVRVSRELAGGMARIRGWLDGGLAGWLAKVMDGWQAEGSR